MREPKTDGHRGNAMTQETAGTTPMDNVSADAPPKPERRPPRKGFNRRSVLQGSAASAAVAAFAKTMPYAAAQGSSFDSKLFLLDRTTFGWDEIAPTRTSTSVQTSMAAESASRTYMNFLDWQLERLGPIDETIATSVIQTQSPGTAHFMGLSMLQMVADPIYGAVSGAPAIIESVRSVVFNGYHNPRQLRLTMTDFWSSVHNTSIRQVPIFFYWYPFYRDVLTQYALGDYGGQGSGMVQDSARHPAMLFYLDQWRSEATNPVENYARELLELHTAGVNQYAGIPTYVENDVVEAAKMFSGWTIDFTPGVYGFTFDGSVQKHALGTKTNSMSNWPGGGTYPYDNVNPTEGLNLITDLVRHPLTALQMSERMINWFLGDFDPMDGPTAEFYNHWLRVAVAFWQSQGDLNATVRTLFDEAHLAESRPGPYRKVRKPLNYAIALLRATGPEHTPASGIEWMSQPFLKMQQVPGYWPAPNGFPADNEAWTNSVVARFEFVHRLVFDPTLGFNFSPARLSALFPMSTRTGMAQRANDILFGGGLPGPEVAAIDSYLLALPTGASLDDVKREAIVMTFSAPSYQFLY